MSDENQGAGRAERERDAILRRHHEACDRVRADESVPPAARVQKLSALFPADRAAWLAAWGERPRPGCSSADAAALVAQAEAEPE